MAFRDWLRPPRSVLTFYAIGAASGVACLVWLAVRLLAQERIVEADRARASLEAAADRAVAAAQRGMNELERFLSSKEAEPPAGTVVIAASQSSVQVRPMGGLVFVPIAADAPVPPLDAFRSGEAAEFGTNGTGVDRAVEAYRALATSPSAPPVVRAGALVRLGRVLRNAGRHADALRAYAELEQIKGISIEGRPADLFAREARCSALREVNDRVALEREADALRRDLATGRWPLLPPLWEFLFSEASDWAGTHATPIDGLEDAVAIARATDSFWREWRNQTPMPSQLIIRADERPILVVWKTEAAGLRAIVAGPARLEAMRSQMSTSADADVALSDRDGQPVAGRLSGPLVLRAATATGLPWNVSIGSAHPDRILAEANSRRQLLLAGLLIVGLLIAGTSYLTFRGIRRELATARLQSDFVSAVSHEFRTPLTSIRQLSHMLREGRSGGDERRAQYYDVLVRESERLHRLVERLLSFGRADAERFRFESLDARDLSRAVVSEFQQHAVSWQFAITVSNADCPLRADREMLSLALWNLLDNAVKYSPGRETIWIDVGASVANVSIAVRDEGGGIATHDRRRVFQKFVRGDQDQASGVAGSGLGLALVDRVVRGHGGVVRLESEVGRGSTFTIVMPIEKTA